MKTFASRVIVACAALAAGSATAQEMRQYNRIPTQSTDTKAMGFAIPAGAREAATKHAVDTAIVEAAVRELAAAWNTPALRALLANSFPQKDQLVDTLARVPRDARLRVVAVQAVNTLNQWEESLGDGRWQPVSRVSATVRTQIEYNDPRTGFQRLDGTNELVLVVRFPR